MAVRPAPQPLRRTALAIAALSAIASLPQLAWAQAEPAKKEAPAAENQVTVVEVTAQGRKQEVLQVPISIQLIGSEQIAKLGSVNIAEVSAFVPGLQIDATEPTQPNFTLRGLGTADFGIGTDSPVGVYVNGVYTGKTGGAMLNFNDIKRVEVLKGPQGTLFGRNSAGGAISIVTNDPTGTFAASGLLRMGNHATLHTEAMVNQPLCDDWALRFSSVTQRREGWTTNVTTGLRSPQDNAWGARLALGWHPDGATNAVLSYEHEDLDQRPRPVWALSPVTPITAIDDEGHLDTSLFVDPRKQPLRNDVVNGREDRLFDGLTLRVEHDLGFATFSSLTAWRQFKTENLQDNDGTANIASHLSTGNFEHNKSWQQEFRLAGNNPTVDWLVGLGLSGEDAKQTSQINTYTNSIDTLAAPPAYGQPPSMGPYASMNLLALLAGAPGINLLGQTWQENMNNTGDFKAQALFGDSIWHLGANTNLTTGIRFTRDEKKFSWYNPLHSSPGLTPQLALFTPEFFAQMVGAGVITQEQADGLQQVVLLSQFGNLEFNNPEWFAAPVYAKKSWTNVSPRLVIDHHFDKDTMVFGSVTRGYQAGGFNSVSTAANGGSFDPETVTNYEIGIKGRLPNSGFSYGASLFHYLFKNLQTITLDTGLPIPAYVVTSSDVQATGADLEAQWQLSKDFRVFGSAELIDQTYKAQRNRAGDSNDLTGQPYGTPTTSLTAGFDVQWALGDGHANWSLQGSYLSATRCNDDSEMQGACLKAPGFRVGEARQRVDTRLGWEADSKQWGVALIVNNLFDKQYVQFLSNLSAPVGSPYYAGLSEPRQIQFEVKIKL